MSIQYVLDEIRAKEDGYRVAGPEPGICGGHWRAKIIPAKSWRNKDGFKFVAEKLWVGWSARHTSSWLADQESCERAANCYLDTKEPHKIIKKV